MLERIHYIKGLGLLHDANGAPFNLQKASLIYADNGRGKSTLASMLRSCSTNNPALITMRKTIDGVNAQEVKLQFTNGQSSSFCNGSWDNQRPELLVFDTDFVEQNVYSGGKVSADQRKNLLQFALGANAVNAQNDYNLADEDTKNAAASVREITSQLSVLHTGMALAQFQQIVEVPDADTQITKINIQISEAENIAKIQAKSIPQELVLPCISLDPIFNILDTSLENIDVSAEEQVRAHLDLHNKHGLEKWVSDGHAYGEEKNCLYCNQPLEGVNLIKAYRSFFNQDYNSLKRNVNSLAGLIETSVPGTLVSTLKSEFDIASAVIESWQQNLELDTPSFNVETASQLLESLISLLEDLKQRKESNLLESIGTDQDKQVAIDYYKSILAIVESVNQSIRALVLKITEYKANKAAMDVTALRQQIINLQWAKKRFEPTVITLISQLATAQVTLNTAQANKQAKKTILNQQMKTILTSYRDSINVLLSNFGAQFKIPEINFNYLGSIRSDYALQMRGSNIALNDGIPDFRTALSESDKRTLAFAFFIASIEADQDLVNKVVVIDDPICSFDLNRKMQTMMVLKRIHDNSQQIILLAHDLHFLRGFRDKLSKQSNFNSNNIKSLKLKAISNEYSDFSNIDIDAECESAYFKAHRLLDFYLQGSAINSLDVARSIRPMLEGYLHRRFPGKINSGLLFGQVISMITNAQVPDPIAHAQDITDELTEINNYVGQFHHDTNPAADQVVVLDGELRTYVIRALNVIHRG